jgi:hypothetical protein
MKPAPDDLQQNQHHSDGSRETGGVKWRKHRATKAECRKCGAPIRIGLTFCDPCRRLARREANKRAARSRERTREVQKNLAQCGMSPK